MTVIARDASPCFMRGCDDDALPGMDACVLHSTAEQAREVIQTLLQRERGAVEALRYLVERCEREFRDQGQPPELDFVMLAVNEVREKLSTGVVDG